MSWVLHEGKIDRHKMKRMQMSKAMRSPPGGALVAAKETWKLIKNPYKPKRTTQPIFKKEYKQDD